MQCILFVLLEASSSREALVRRAWMFHTPSFRQPALQNHPFQTCVNLACYSVKELLLGVRTQNYGCDLHTHITPAHLLVLRTKLAHITHIVCTQLSLRYKNTINKYLHTTDRRAFELPSATYPTHIRSHHPRPSVYVLRS